LLRPASGCALLVHELTDRAEEDGELVQSLGRTEQMFGAM
jgi:hypothetical protein